MSSTPIKCPKCAVAMEQHTAGETVVDRCTKCQGIWLDHGERLKLVKDKAAVAAIDTGSAEAGQEQDAITEVNCPQCDVPMVHVSDRAQKHVGFEICRECQGSFFDAGELTDLSEFTLSERIRSLLGR